jgi:hypothetical protein
MPTPKKKKKSAAKGVTPAQFRKIALSFPESHEKESYGNQAIFVVKKFFTRYRKNDDSLVFIVDSMETRDMMLELDPKTYFITEHYKDYPSVLVRMERISTDELQTMLERRWRQIAPKKLVKEIEEKASAGAAKHSPARTKPKKAKAVTRKKRVG